MSFLAANPAGFPPPVPAPCRAGERGPIDVPRRWRIASFLRRTCLRVSDCNYGGLPQPTYQWQLCSGACLPLCIPSYAWSPLRGSPGARQHSVFCFAFCAPSGSRFLPKQVCKQRQRTPRKLLSSPSEKADLRPWEPDPLARLRPV
jgi:hypothetical protein